MEDSLMMTYPSVYAVEDEYLVCVPVDAECTMWVEVGGKSYFDHSNGILRSAKYLHIARVPMAALDEARSYKVCLRRIIERKAYFSECGGIEERVFEFRPVAEKAEYKFVNLADSHSRHEAAARSGSFFGDDLDFLIMNGDVPECSESVDMFKAIYLISGPITKGRIPCVFSRGNHDLRGVGADMLADYTPTTRAGESYFTFHLGPVWGIVIDCGEDKVDECNEYGHTVCCEVFREEEEAFIRRVVSRKAYKRYPVRLVVSHMPFNYLIPDKQFQIEIKRYKRWCRLVGRMKPTLMLSGHLHECYTEAPGGAHDSYGLQPGVAVCSSYVRDQYHVSGAITLSKDAVRVRYADSDGGFFAPDDEMPLV